MMSGSCQNAGSGQQESGVKGFLPARHFSPV
jgi:hypothetical protein